MNFLHDSVLCVSSTDILLKFLGVVIAVAALVLRFIFSKLKKFSRNPLYYDATLGNENFWFEIALNSYLTLSHILSVVLPSNKTKLEKLEIKASLKELTVIGAVKAKQNNTSNFLGFFDKQPY